MRTWHSLQTKLMLSFVLLILIIAGSTFLLTYQETKDALKEGMREELMGVASAVSTQLDGDAISALKAGDEETTDFLIARDRLSAVKAANPNIKYIYTYRLTSEKQVEFVVDADYGKDPEAATVGQVQEEMGTGRMTEGVATITADDEFTTDEWGTVLSGYAPIMNSQGAIIGAVGVDMASERVIARQQFIGTISYLIIAVAILVAAAIIGLFSITIIRDIKKLNAIATDISTGKMDVSMDIDRKDEIGELAASFGRMVASIKIMASAQNEKPKKK